MGLLSGILGGVAGGADAVNQLSGERRKQLAEQLRMETMETLQNQRQDREFAFREGMAARGDQQAERMADIGQQHRIEQDELRHQREVEAGKYSPKPSQYTAVTTADGVYMVDKENPAKREKIGAAPPKGGKGDDRREPPASLAKMLWENAEKQARGERGGFLGVGGKSKEETNQRTLEIYQGFLSDLGYGPEASAQPQVGGVLPADQPGAQPAGAPQPSGVNWRDYVPQSAPGDTAQAQAADPGPTMEAAGLLPGPPASGAPQATAAPSPASAMPPRTGTGEQGAKMPIGRRATPEQKQAAMQELVDLTRKVGLGKENWQSLWDMLSGGAKAAWGSYANFVNEGVAKLTEGQRDARKQLTGAR